MVADESELPKMGEMSKLNKNRTILKGHQLCRVIHMDGKDEELEIDKNAKGEDLLDKLAQQMDLAEKDYFGLSYRDSEDKRNWLSSDKRISKQLKNLPWVFWFEVKFYPPEPSQLQEDLTRYYLCLQVRNDVVSGKLPCSFVTYALLGSYLMQSQLGDYDEGIHGPPDAYLSHFSFAPHQTYEMLCKINELHKTHRGLTPAQAETAYLENAKKLAMYGVDLHQAKDSDGADILLGVCSAGLLVYRDKLRINRFAWPKILKISYRRSGFYINIRRGEFEQRETTVGFRLPNSSAAERLWVACVEHHTFFRLMAPEHTPKRGLFRFGSSKYRYSGRTQYQSRLASGMIERPQPAVPRSVSAGPLSSQSMDPISSQATYKQPTRPMSTVIYGGDNAKPRGRSEERKLSDYEDQGTLDVDRRKMVQYQQDETKVYGYESPKSGTSTPSSDKDLRRPKFDEPVAVVIDGDRRIEAPTGYIFGEVHPTGKSRKELEREKAKAEKTESKRKETLEKERKRLVREMQIHPNKHAGVILEGTPIESNKKSRLVDGRYGSSSLSSPTSDDERYATNKSPTISAYSGPRQISPRTFAVGLHDSTSTPVKTTAPHSLSMDESGLVDRVETSSPRRSPPVATYSPTVSPASKYFAEPLVSTIIEHEESYNELPVRTFSTFAPDGNVKKTTKSTEVKTTKKTLQKQIIQPPVPVAPPKNYDYEIDEQNYHRFSSPIDVGIGVERTGSPYSVGSSNGVPMDPKAQIVSSQTKLNGSRTVETVKYKTEKDGVVETHVEHCVIIHSDKEIDHDAELSAAILEATKMNPNMTVEKVEVRRASAARQTEL